MNDIGIEGGHAIPPHAPYIYFFCFVCMMAVWLEGTRAQHGTARAGTACGLAALFEFAGG